MKKRFLALLLTLIMVFALVPQAAFAATGTEAEIADTAAAEPAETRAADGAKAGTTYLAFTSDIHNGTASGGETNVSNIRLTTWLSNVMPKYNNDIHVFGFCGDMASASSSTSTFWTFTNTVMENIASHNLTGIYTTGNHEYGNGGFDSTSNSPEVRAKYSLNKEARGEAGENYVVYCLGTNSGHGSSWAYDDSQITSLTNYLNSVSNDKVIIILTHFPLHNYSMHTTGNTEPVLNALNNAAAGADGVYGNADDKKIVFLWGHNHSEGDPEYDQVYFPGDKINTNNKEVKFFYAAAGCMADSEYGRSASVKGKGLVLEISSNNKLSFTYYDANGNNVTEPNGETRTEKDPVAISGVTISRDSLEVLEGRTLQLTYTTNPSDATTKTVSWSSSNTAIATVNSTTGLVRGVAEGKANITVTISDGLAKNTVTDTVEITVAHNDNPTQEITTSVTPSTSNPEENITINVGDTLIVNVTNGSSSSAYDFTASLSKTGVAQIEGSSSVNIAAGGTGTFTFTGLTDGTVNITIQNNNSYGSSYTRKATIHLTVGDGSTTPIVGDTVDVTPTTDNPEEYVKINIGDTLTINVTNSSSNSAYDFTATLSKSGVAQLNGSSTVNIAQGGTGQFTVTGLTDGTVDITIQNNNSYGSQYTRKAVIHLTVGEGGDTPVDPPVGDTVNITPSTSNPEESIKINVGDTLTINVTNGSSNSAYNYSATLSNSGIAQFQGSTTVNIAAGGTGTFTVTGLAEGTVDITIQNDQSSSSYVRKGTIHLTVGDGTTPVGDPVTYQLTDTLEAGKNYIFANANSGSVYVVSNQANGSKTLKGISATVSNNTITLSSTDATKAEFSAVANSNSSQNGLYLMNGTQYLYADSSNGLRMVASSTQTSSDNQAKSWHYKGDGKNVLWFFKDTSSSDGYTDTSSTYKYYIDYSNGNFMDSHVSTTSLANSDTQAIYLYTEVTEQIDVQSITLTPSTLNMTAGETANLTVSYTPANATLNKTITWSSSNSNVASVANGVVTAVAAGSATITATTTNGKTASCTVTVKAASTVTYTLTDKLEAGKEYIIANGNTGSVYVVSNEANGSKTLKGIAATVSGEKITLTAADAAKAVFSAVANSNSAQNGLYLMNGEQYLYSDSSNGLRLVAASTQTSSDNRAKSWHYKGDGKNVLWFFKDTSSSDGYTDTSSTYKYYIDYSNGNFMDSHVSTTSLANSDTRAIYLYVKSDQQAPSGEYTVAVTADKTEVQPGETINFTITLLAPMAELGSFQVVLDIPAGLTYTKNSLKLVSGAAAALGFENTGAVTVSENNLMVNGYGTPDHAGDDDIPVATFQCKVDSNFSGTVNVSLKNLEFTSVDQDWLNVTDKWSVTPAEIKLYVHTHTYGSPVWTWTGNDTDGYTAASATFECTGCGASQVVDAPSVTKTENTGYTVYTATVTFNGQTYTDTKRVVVDYTITYNLGEGATVSGTNPTTYNVDTDTFTLINPTRTGYNFIGWSGTGISGTSMTVTISKGSTGNRTYTANWEVIGYQVSGSIKSFVGTREGYDDYVYVEGAVTVKLFAPGATTAAYEATVSADNKTYTFTEPVVPGTYEMKVEKKDHVTRTYDITVSNAAVTQNVEIHLLGDVNGDGVISTVDAALANAHAREATGGELTGYDLLVADVNGIEGVSTGDAAIINAHAREYEFLW